MGETRARNFRFSERVLNWAAKHGRKNLPWQLEITPYRVWVSEIMLQQTRVDTVIAYFERFMQRFPEVGDLASAPLDTVLAYWAGLGYYARARNLHKAARLIASAGRFPDELETLCRLPGIGRSTAGAILSVAFRKKSAILDGNVKRVLARFHGIEGQPDESAVKRELWRLSEQHTPEQDCREYTQAIMDLGATLCRRHKPNCPACPVVSDCIAFVQGRTDELPGSRKQKKIPARSCIMLMLTNQDGHCYLIKRPPTGIWGGLWGFPEFPSKRDTIDWCAKSRASNLTWWPSERHSFTHYHLDYTPATAQWRHSGHCVRENEPGFWCDPNDHEHLALPVPIKKLVDRLGTVDQNPHPNQITIREP